VLFRSGVKISTRKPGYLVSKRWVNREFKADPCQRKADNPYI